MMFSGRRRPGRARRGKLGVDLRLIGVRQVQPTDTRRKVHPGQASVEPGAQKVPRVAGDRIALLEERLHPLVQIFFSGHCAPPGWAWNPCAAPSSRPPSITSVSPVIQLAASETRNATASATSTGSPILPSAIDFASGSS